MLQGPQGPAGEGIDTLTEVDFTIGNRNIQYDTIDGIKMSSTGRFSYQGGNRDATFKLNVPIIGDNGITIEKQANAPRVIVKTPIKIEETITTPTPNTTVQNATVEFTPIPSDSAFNVSDTTYKFYKGSTGQDQGFYTFEGYYISHSVTEPTSKLLYYDGPLGNVKTINGESIYGSGDITVGGSVALYRHNIKMNSSQHQVYFTLISSSDTALNTAAKIANEINATVSATGVVTNGDKKLWVYCVDALAVLGGVTIYAMNEAGNNITVNGSQLTITDKVKAI